MSHQCHGDHCHQSHGHSSCSNQNCGCSNCNCGSDCKCKCHESECNFAHQLLELADEAWMCLLKEKIKAKIQNISGGQLDQLADLVANSNHERWINKMASKKACESFEDKVADFFDHKH